MKQQKSKLERDKVCENAKRQADICNAYQLREVKGASFYSQTENLKELAKSQATKGKPVLSLIKDTREDLKKQLEKCRRAQNTYVI